MKYSGIGGQAVMEGVMMRNGTKIATAVRQPNGEIALKVENKGPAKEGVRKIPFLRGPVLLVDSLVTGIKTLEYSASFFEEEETKKEEAQPAEGIESDEDSAGTETGSKAADKAKKSKPQKESWIEKHLTKEQQDKLVMAVAVLLALVMSLGMFMLLPVLIAALFRPIISSSFGISLLEGLGRVALFVLYIYLISLMPEIKRVFMYHGAEHKCINCIEHGLLLNVENVRVSTRLHKRCGTSFLLYVMIISVFVSIFLPHDQLWLRLLTRLLVIPVVVSVSYEFIQLAGRYDNWFFNALSQPGLWLQRLTTREPDDSMIEVGIASVEAVFDWKTWEREELGVEIPEEPEEAEKPEEIL